MLDELATEKPDVEVGLVAVVQVTVRPLLVLVVGVKRVAGRVGADESLAGAHEIKQRLLARRRHGRLLVRARGAQVARGVEKHRVKPREIIFAEFRAVLGEREFPSILFAELEEDFLGMVRLAVLPRNNGVLESA